MDHWTDKPNPEFERWWATKTAAGYQYGREALENVRFGFEGAQSMRWQPIETAPKDGRAVLLLSAPYEQDAGPNGKLQVPAKAAIGHWWGEGTSWVDDLGRADAENAYTLAKTGVWLSGGGWFQPNEVTHWMPLLDPPSVKEVTNGR